METNIVDKRKPDPMVDLRPELLCIQELDELIINLKEVGAPIIENPTFLKLNCEPKQATYWVQYADRHCLRKQQQLE